MKVCLELVSPQGCTPAEYNIIVKPDCKCSGEKIRENLPKALYGNDIKINFIVKCCDEVLEAPSVPCDNLFALSQPILVKDSNPCNCPQNDDDCCYCDFDNCNYDCNYGLNEDFTSMCCCSCSKEKHYAIIIRSFSPIISQILYNYPQMYITDCSKTVKLTFIFDKNGSVSPCLPCCNDCGCGCGGCVGCGGGFGNGFGGCGGWFWIILLLCFCW
ncbi:hypothetical protein [Clostridium septicum]|uniref:hypothetical protein n=1 Tax=Clostridium septicum TaxID=1504 RepID=UPI000FF8BE07|nr:hypothetical protein [Clostridium septicum]QAS61567.1 hypothetical protein EI377_12940 [Clostridium septicum]